MPRPGLPPTPGSSTTFKPQNLDMSVDTDPTFALPPPALATAEPPSPVSPATEQGTPTSPLSRRGSTTRDQRLPSFSAIPLSVPASELPPPPTRSRKIIQVKPALQPAPAKPSASSDANTSATTKKKGPTPTSAAGRKIARKTAHSLIERRRRSKMNEEFGVLKGMIPACNGVEMHKLAILQASIEYLRYLEDCVAELKGTRHQPVSSEVGLRLGSRNESMDLDDAADDDQENDSSQGDDSSSPSQSAYTPSPALQAVISPSIYPTFQSSLNLTTFALPGPVAMDAEAGHALMMLGATGERRGSDRRGIRVSDLLTS